MDRLTSNLNQKAQILGKSLFAAVHREQPSLGVTNRWTQEVMKWCLSNLELKSRILRFVDVLPTLKTDKSITEHVRAYFPSSESRLPLALRSGSFFTQTPFTSRAVANITRHMVREIAQQFICGETMEEAKKSLDRLVSKGMDFSIDVLGESVTSHKEADNFQTTYMNILDGFPAPTNVSVKLSSLTPRFDPLNWDNTIRDVLKRLIPIVELAKKKESFVNVDVEQYEHRDLTLEIFKRLLSHEKVKGYGKIGTVFQSYLRDAEAVLQNFLDWLSDNKQPLTIRLVKGAYWDSEVAKAEARGWPVPVYLEKNNTDAQFERMTETLLKKRDLIRVAIASHNIRSVAYALACHEESTFGMDTLEFQLLYGMADPLKLALLEYGHKVRVYSPYGPLIPGMSYLVRRILENTSNESFLKMDYVKEANEDVLLAPPLATDPIPALKNKPSNTLLKNFSNEPLLDFSKEEVRTKFASVCNQLQTQLGKDYPLLINGKAQLTDQWTRSLNPSYPDQTIGKVGRSQWGHVEEAIKSARLVQPKWDQTPAHERSACLMRAAQIMRERRMELAGLEILETGKTWREADADVAEAIDFLEYYPRLMIHKMGAHSFKQVPGERNVPLYHGRGIAAIIAPWNFPLAILTGMTAAALVTGNAALVKPAETSSVLGYQLVDILLQAGIPPEIVAFIPGPGSEIGNGLVRHPDVDVIAFTGSKEIGLSIIQQAGETSPAQMNIKKVVAELGGKNAIIVDEDADQDEALIHILSSAFGYQGQKCSACSRLILMDSIYDPFINRLIEATKALVTGNPLHPNTDMGPVIDLTSMEKINKIITEGKQEARFVFQGSVSKKDSKGYFIPPTLFSDAPRDGVLAQVEIFGPVLTIFRAHNFEEALDIANDSHFALTAGLFSRNLRHIEMAKKNWVAGNLYINRKVTGAMVGRQPFGGFRMSGTGSKAGGPDYLDHFTFQTTITENTFRHGFPL